MNSTHVKELLSAYLDNELEAEEMQAVEEHLEGCLECRQDYEALQETVRMLSSLEEVIPPASFRRELREKLERSSGKNKFTVSALIPNWMKNLKRNQLIPGAVALVLMIIIIPFVGSNLPRMGSSDKATESIMSMEDSGGFSGLGGGEQMQNQKMMAPEAREDAAGIMPAAETPTDMSYMATKSDTNEQVSSRVIEENIERKIIKNADLQLQVDEYNMAVEALKQKVMLVGGYIANENVNTVGREGSIYGYLQIRIPALEFDNFLSGLDSLGKVRNRNIYTHDVTEEYVDVESRLKALRTKEERLLDILTKSGQLSDILAVENELANTRAQLESLQGRLRYLDNRTDFSAISINIEQLTASTQQISNPGLSDVIKKAKEAFIKTINNILIGISNLVVFIGAVIPYLVLVGIAVLVVWLFVKKKK